MDLVFIFCFNILYILLQPKRKRRKHSAGDDTTLDEYGLPIIPLDAREVREAHLLRHREVRDSEELIDRIDKLLTSVKAWDAQSNERKLFFLFYEKRKYSENSDCLEHNLTDVILNKTNFFPWHLLNFENQFS